MGMRTLYSQSTGSLDTAMSTLKRKVNMHCWINDSAQQVFVLQRLLLWCYPVSSKSQPSLKWCALCICCIYIRPPPFLPYWFPFLFPSCLGRKGGNDKEISLLTSKLDTPKISCNSSCVPSATQEAFIHWKEVAPDWSGWPSLNSWRCRQWYFSYKIWKDQSHKF